MNNIFQFGCYFVGSEKAHICHNYSEVIVLKLKKAKAITKTEYKLEELRDLESKLVLITGSKAKCRDSVDIFIDVRTTGWCMVYRAASGLIILRVLCPALSIIVLSQAYSQVA